MTPPAAPERRTRVFTVGHGARPPGALEEVLQDAGVARVVDVRRWPASRRHPHFGREELTRALLDAGITYEWREDLGGRRRSPDGSRTRHPAWRNAAFRAYADHMDTGEFRASLAALERRAEHESVAVMCSETLWWRCHRRLIADALWLHGVEVVHLMAPGTRHVHEPHESLRGDEAGAPVYDVGPAVSLRRAR